MSSSLRVAMLTALTMIAFAANSVFCRLALVDPANDPVAFTLARLGSGALVLAVFWYRLRSQQASTVLGLRTFAAPLLLLAYALFFSIAYVSMDAGTGALILFACVQLTMLVVVFVKRQPLGLMEKIGVATTLVGFVYLVLPGAGMPPLRPAAWMAVAGVSWGLYSLLGKGAPNATLATARNFVFTVPLLGLIAVFSPLTLSGSGLLWACLSGALTSGLGYVLWYQVLRDLTTSTASIVQLTVPALAAFGGVLFLGEHVSLRLIVASVLILGGIALKVRGGQLRER